MRSGKKRNADMSKLPTIVEAMRLFAQTGAHLVKAGEWKGMSLEARHKALLALNQTQAGIGIMLDELEATFPPVECALAPYGWLCTRLAGHAGPCAAIQVLNDDSVEVPLSAEEFSIENHPGFKELVAKYEGDLKISPDGQARVTWPKFLSSGAANPMYGVAAYAVPTAVGEVAA